MSEQLSFDYANLSREERQILKDREKRIKEIMVGQIKSMIDVGGLLADTFDQVSQASFEGWCQSRIGMSSVKATKLIGLARKASKNPSLLNDSDFADEVRKCAPSDNAIQRIAKKPLIQPAATNAGASTQSDPAANAAGDAISPCIVTPALPFPDSPIISQQPRINPNAADPGFIANPPRLSANAGGRMAEDTIESVLKDAGLKYDRHFYVGHNVFGSRIKPDFYIPLKCEAYPNGFCIESKFGQVHPSAIRYATFFTLHQACHYSCPVILVVQGNVLTEHVSRDGQTLFAWAKSYAEQLKTRAGGESKIKAVMTFEDFRAYIMGMVGDAA